MRNSSTAIKWENKLIFYTKFQGVIQTRQEAIYESYNQGPILCTISNKYNSLTWANDFANSGYACRM